VHDARLVRGGQRVEQVQADASDGRQSERPVDGEGVGERARGQQLHDDPGASVLLDHVVDGHGARMRHARRCPRLAEGALAGDLAVRADHRPQLLDGDLAAEHLVTRRPQHAHTAATDDAAQAVPPGDDPVFCTCWRRHRGVMYPVVL
jgi:hypothetical protein